MHNQLLSTAEVADLLRKSPSAVARMAHRGELQYQFKAPGRTGGMFFDPDVISAYVADQESKDEARRQEGELAAAAREMDRRDAGVIDA